GRAGASCGQSVALEAVDDASDAARGQAGLGREVGHPQLAAGRAGEAHEHLEVDHAQVVLADLAAQPRVQAGEGLDEEPDCGDPWIVKQFTTHPTSLAVSS